ncbi:hypothetical protein RJ639_040208 [Escallonia herrerae]|uniref:RNase H type-1 domain-containing protein n=1 Tax=Escallonia herrerae TaxID=1293975 RepID=A0AA89B2Q7_9ASTE|nr:hypothetical protein RJ639_040208 [Escallonia herrerae]
MRGECRDNQYHIWRISRRRVIVKVKKSIRQINLKDVKTPHDDPLVIIIKAGNFQVKRVLIDNGSSAEILFYEAFKKMNFPTDRLRKMDTPLYGFSNHPVAVKGPLCIQRHIGMTSTQSVTGYGVDLPPQDEIPYGTRDRRGERRPDYRPSVLRDFMLIEEQGSTHYRRPPRRYKDANGRTDLVRRTQNLLEFSTLAFGAIPRRRLVSVPLGHRSRSQRCLVREEDGVQKPIYYVSKVLQDVETRYPKIDRIALALIILAMPLRPYIQSHSIIVLTDQPLRKVLLSPEASERLVNWSVELGEFDIQYKPHTAIKAQALADFIVECTLPEDPPQLVISEVTDPWNLYVDGSSAVGSSGAGIILISLEGFTIEYALRFGFQASNNEAEYEALLAG